MQEIIFVTGNENKLKEATAILKGFKVVNKAIELPELQGKSEEIVKEKSRIAANMLKEPCFVDDTSLCFNALGGLPGPYIKHFLEKLGIEKLPKLLAAFNDKSAKAVARVGFCEPGKEPVLFEGIVEGTIVEPRGITNFGWDPIFLPDGSSKTYAEMGFEEKIKCSHRIKVLNKFEDFLKKRFG